MTDCTSILSWERDRLRRVNQQAERIATETAKPRKIWVRKTPKSYHPVRRVDERDFSFVDFPCIASATREHKLSTTAILHSIQDGIVCGGFRWFSLKPDAPVVELQPRKARIVRCLSNGKAFNSVTDAITEHCGPLDRRQMRREWMRLMRAINRGQEWRGMQFEFADCGCRRWSRAKPTETPSEAQSCPTVRRGPKEAA